MSAQKAKQITELSRLPRKNQYDALLFETPLHREAFDFKIGFHHALCLRADPKSAPREHRKFIKANYVKKVNMFARRFIDAYYRRNGEFFRALADVIEGQNPNWSNRERFICAQCSIAENLGETLPSAGQLLRGWKINCGLLPEDKQDLQVVWQYQFGKRPMPKRPSEIESALRPHLGRANEAAARVQIVQIAREAKNLGFDLPRQPKGYCLPAGFAWMP